MSENEKLSFPPKIGSKQTIIYKKLLIEATKKTMNTAIKVTNLNSENYLNKLKGKTKKVIIIHDQNYLSSSMK